MNPTKSSPTARPPGWLRSATALCLAGSLGWGCAPESALPVLTAVEMDSPAGEGSGEPFLSAGAGEILLSWLEAVTPGGHQLRFSRLASGAWEAPTVIAESTRFFVNWADFPSVTSGPDGTLWAHWLERGAEGGYDYGIRIVRSGDEGRTWTEPWVPHDDGTPTEHGFVAAVPAGEGMGFLWLDGRRYAQGEGGGPGTSEMGLYFRTVGVGGEPGPETVVDARVCDCCQTDLALTAEGPIAVYRDRSPDEIRDIYVARLRDGVWTSGSPVHADGWETGACPVNGPSVAARGDRVAVAWFTAAGGVPRVKVAFSGDAGRTFAEPVVVDDGDPAGRADVVMLPGGGVVVSWLERVGGELAEVLVRYVAPNGSAGASVTVSRSSSGRASGFPRLIQTPDGGDLIAAWTDATSVSPRVRVARIQIQEAP